MRSKLVLLETFPEYNQYDDQMFLRCLQVSLEAQDEFLYIKEYPPVLPPTIEAAEEYIIANNIPFRIEKNQGIKDIKNYIDRKIAPVIIWDDILPNWVCIFGYQENLIDKLFISTGNSLQSLEQFPDRANAFILPSHKLKEFWLKRRISCSLLIPDR